MTECFKSQVVDIFDQTVLQCKQRMDVGVYARDSKFLFLIENESEMEDVVFEKSHFIKKHPRVAFITKVDTKAVLRFKIFGYNFITWQNKKVPKILNYIWSPQNRITNISDAFTDISNFQGNTLELKLAIIRLSFIERKPSASPKI